MKPPHPDTLEPTRQARVRERFVVRAASVLLFSVALVNLFAAPVGSIWLGYPQPVGAVAVLVGIGLPSAGLLGVVWWSRRHMRAAFTAIETDFPANPGAVPMWLAMATVGGMGAVALLAAQPSAFSWGLFTAQVGLVIALVRMVNGARLPAWALAFVAAWGCVGGLGFALGPPLEPHVTALFGVGWYALAPFGPLVWTLRGFISGLARLEGPIGRLGRAWAVFLPAAQRSRLLALDGDTDEALAVVTSPLGSLRHSVPLGESLVVLAELLHARGDSRAAKLYCVSASLIPSDARPFLGLARVVQETDPQRARAYIQFAEENAARTVGGIDPELVALRDALLGVRP